jgi:AraC family transcriptional regulator
MTYTSPPATARRNYSMPRIATVLATFQDACWRGKTAKTIKRSLSGFAIKRPVSRVLSPSQATLREYKQRILRVLVHIQERLDERLELEDLARIACLSPFHFHRVFTGMTGESVMGYIRRLRLERAASDLRLNQSPITELALRAGYDSHEAFTRAFKAAYGVAPVHFRSEHGRVPSPRAPSGVHYQSARRLRNFKALRGVQNALKVIVKELAPIRVAFMRHVGPYEQVGTTWDKLLVRLGRDGWIGGDAMFIGICHDDPEVTAPAKLRYDACLSVGAEFRPVDEIGAQTLAGRAYAITTHFGAYERIGRTYAKLLGQWLPRSGWQLRPLPCFEVYLNSPESTEPRDLLTDIHVPLTTSSHLL